MPANRSIVAGITYLPPAAAFLTAAMMTSVLLFAFR
jgi:hypothetical protein